MEELLYYIEQYKTVGKGLKNSDFHLVIRSQPDRICQAGLWSVDPDQIKTKYPVSWIMRINFVSFVLQLMSWTKNDHTSNFFRLQDLVYKQLTNVK